MAEGLDLVRLYIRAQGEPSPEMSEAFAENLTEDAVLKTSRGSFQGREAIRQQLGSPLNAGNFRQAEWSKPEVKGDSIAISGRLPITATVGGYDLRFELVEGGRVGRIEQTTLPAPPLPPSPLRLDEEMKQTIAEAWRGATILVISVDPEGRAVPSLRGTVQAFGDDKLAFWARNGDGATVRALDSNSNLTFFYRNPPARTTYIFYGRGHVTGDASERTAIYDNSPEPERLADIDMKGVAIIAELERVEGAGPNGRVLMVRDTKERTEHKM
jgi:hypothetical protein